jgi:hypothetical protein
MSNSIKKGKVGAGKAGLKAIAKLDRNFVGHCVREIRRRIDAGEYTDRPGLEAALESFDPAMVLIEAAANPANDETMRAAIADKLMPYWHESKSIVLKRDDSGNGDKQITVVIAPWATAGGGTPGSLLIDAPKQNEAPDAEARPVMPVEVTGDDELEARRQQPASEPQAHPAPCLCNDCFVMRVNATRDTGPRIITDDGGNE